MNILREYKYVTLCFVVRFMLKDLLSFTEGHFMGSTPANLHIGLDIGGSGSIQDWAIPLSPRPSLCHQELDLASDAAIKEVVMDHSPPPASAFQFDYVEVGPIN